MNTDEKIMHEQAVGTEQANASITTEEAQAVPANENATTPSKRPKKSAASIGVICAIVFLSLYAIVNVSVFASLFTGLMSLLTPIILGGAIAYILNPILKLFENRVFKKIKKKSVLRGLSLLMTYIVALLIVFAFLLLLIPQLIQSIMDFASNFDYYISHTSELINEFIANVLDDPQMDHVVDKESILSMLTNLLSQSGDLFSSIMNYVVEYGTGFVIGIKNLLLAIFISIYVLSSKERLKAQMHKFSTAVFSNKGTRRAYRYLRLCDRTFGGFFVGKIIDSLIIGVITLVVLLIARMPYALLISTIICITNIIPVFGPFLGAIPSFFIIFIVNPTKALIFLILILLIQQLDGNVIGPRILGNTTGLSSLGVIISIIIMGDLFGLIGMLVGVPIFAVIVALIKEFLEHRLRKKNCPTDTAEYYDADSLVDPHEVHESVSARLFKNIGQGFAKLFRKNKSKQNKQEMQKDSKK